MDKELIKYYENRFTLFSTEGWKQLIEDVETMIQSTNNLNGVNSDKELFFKKGELSILFWIKGLEEITNSAYEELTIESDISV